MKTPEEMLTRGTGSFINCTDYDDAVKAMKEYGDLRIAEYREGCEKALTDLLEDYERNKHKMTYEDYTNRRDITFHCLHEIQSHSSTNKTRRDEPYNNQNSNI